MMLDNKNEQKWPLTEEKSSKERSVKGHFFFCPVGSWERKKSSLTAALTYLSYHTGKSMSTLFFEKQSVL